MNTNDREHFFEMWSTASETYEKHQTENMLKMAFNLLSQFDLHEIQRALQQHMRDPESGKWMPKPADIIGKIEAMNPDGHPGPEQAWSMYPKSELQTACVTQEMHTAWSATYGLDDIAGRMAFKEVYTREVARSKLEGRRPVWKMTIGHDPNTRDEAVMDAIESGLLTAKAAHPHLPYFSIDELKRLETKNVSATDLLTNRMQKISSNVPRLISQAISDDDRETALENLDEIRKLIAGDNG